MQIFLIGFMGCGKTTYGKGLAQLMDVDFFDLDDYIAHKRAKSISQIFEESGEAVFRKYEFEALREISKANSNFVLATGGGTPCFATNLDFINTQGISVYLKCSVEELCENIMLSNPNRPLLKGKNAADLHEFVQTLLLEREAVYSQAHMVLTSENHQPEKLFDLITKFSEFNI